MWMSTAGAKPGCDPGAFQEKKLGFFGQGTLRYLAIVICLVVRGDNPI